MSGDSPTSVHKENAFNYDTPGRSTPPPTTSYLASKHDTQHQPPAIDSTAVAEPAKEEKEKEKDGKEGKDGKDDPEFCRPDANPGYKPESDKKSDSKKGDSKDGGGGGGGDEKKPDKKVNGTDKLDGKWVPPVDKKSDDGEEEEDDSCIVNCLYYTLQCCECTIT